MVGRPKIAKREGGDGRRTRESPLFAAFFAIPSNRLTRPGLDGWGGRYRTSEWCNLTERLVGEPGLEPEIRVSLIRAPLLPYEAAPLRTAQRVGIRSNARVASCQFIRPSR